MSAPAQPNDFWLPPESDADIAVDGDSDDDGANAPVFANGRDATIYVIDATAIGHEGYHMNQLIETIELNMLNRIIQSDRDLVGVITYNVEHSPEPADDTGGTEAARQQTVPKNTAIVVPMQLISVACIDYIKTWRYSDNGEDFMEDYGCINQNADAFVEMLWLCSRMLTSCDYKLASASIVLLTVDNNPLGGNREATQRAFVRARDLRTLNVDLVLAPVIADGTFDMEPFYRELICTVSDLDPETFDLMNTGDILESLTMRSYQRDYRRTCQRYFNLDLGGGLLVGCGLYGLWQWAPMPKGLLMNAPDNEVVQARRCYVRSEPAADDDDQDELVERERVLLPGELIRHQIIGGRKIAFSVEELTQVKTAMTPGMRLLGFKPMSELPARQLVKPSRLLYPSEKYLQGSTQLLRALWECCKRRQLFALCVFTPRRKMAPRYVALVPQKHNNHFNVADGFCVVYVPMQTDIRELDIFDRPVPPVTDEQEHIMDNLIENTSFRYQPRMFEDPFLCQFFANLESVVFDETHNVHKDMSMPDKWRLEHIIGELEPLLVPAFGEDVPAPASKRLASGRTDDDSAEASSAPKSAKGTTSGGQVVLGIDEMRRAMLSGTADRLTAAMLRGFLLQFTDLKSLSKVKKQDLLDLVRQHCGQV